ncbi:hypothetical protein E6O75_ATG11718 [Venturia nashicola]|uniref:Cell wall protein n=1 Tax=Venturia nashicola TaxID=86259 RepID=A0A4Z1NLV1_9PEZI|nr:hypothetical protein E6O75_ATG11718 [Venturia nashicola]
MRSFTLLFAISGIVLGSPVPQAEGMGSATPAAPGLPGGLSLPPGITLPAGFDPSMINPEAIGNLIGSIPPGFLESITSGGGLGGLDIGALLGGGGPDNETPVIIAGYTATSEKEKALDAAIAAIPATGDATASITSVITAAKDVITSLKDGTTKVSAIGTVNLVASSGLTAPGAELTDLFEKTATALAAKKDVVVKAGKKAEVLEVAKGIKEAVKGFTDVIEKHLPPLSKDAAQTEHAKGLASADKIITAFS